MDSPSYDKSAFKYQYLPDYAKFLLTNKLEEFVTVGIRFAREYDIPMMRPLARIPEDQLIATSIHSNREMLSALAENNVADFIDKNISNYIANTMKDENGNIILDRSEVVAEDFILGYYLRRKLFAFFLYSYTQNSVLHMLIASEVDAFTTKEQLLSTKAYISIIQKTPVNNK